jgi:hypothetical protein
VSARSAPSVARKTDKGRARKLAKRLKNRSFRRRMSAHQTALAKWGLSCKGCAYVDDIALAGKTKAQSAAAVSELVKILFRMGLPAVDKDLMWEPKQRQKFLGVYFDTRKEHPLGSGNYFSDPEKKPRCVTFCAFLSYGAT